MVKIKIDSDFYLHPKYKELYCRCTETLKKFPEIKQISLSSFYPDMEENKNVAAFTRDEGVSFNRTILPSYTTIYHEFYHIVQYLKKEHKRNHVLEREATILGAVRMPKKHVEHGILPFTGIVVPKDKVLFYLEFAKNEILKGNKNYMATLNRKVSKDIEADARKDYRNLKNWKANANPVLDLQKIKVKISEKDIIKYLKSHAENIPANAKTIDDIKPYIVTSVKNTPNWLKCSVAPVKEVTGKKVKGKKLSKSVLKN